jgi:hypothetical protein
MYKSIDHMLCEAFYINNKLIIGKSNSARIEEWIKSKGVVDRVSSGLNQHDLHANSTMILTRVSNILNDIEWMLIKAEYGYDLSGIIDLTNYVLNRDSYIQPLECDALLEYIFIRNKTYIQLQDKFDWGAQKLSRKLAHVKSIINKLHYECIEKLEIKMGDDILVKESKDLEYSAV